MIHQLGPNATRIEQALAASKIYERRFYHYSSGRNQRVQEVVDCQSRPIIACDAPHLASICGWDELCAWLDAVTVAAPDNRCAVDCPPDQMADQHKTLRADWTITLGALKSAPPAAFRRMQHVLPYLRCFAAPDDAASASRPHAR